MKYCDHALERNLRERLLVLNFHAFLRAISVLLLRMGYSNVELSGRTGWVGRNADGGYDLIAFLPVPGGTRRVIVQVKQYVPERRIYQRTIDELRGVCLRAGASEALLITTSSFSDTVNAGRLATVAIAPVRLIDGRELTELMALHRVGVWEEASASADEPVHRGVDEAFFIDLEEAYQGIRRANEEDQEQFFLSLIVSSRKRRAGKPANPKKAALPQRS